MLLATLLVVLALACLLNVFGRFNHNRNRDRVVADLVQSAAAIQAYMRQNGVGPPTSSAGALPTGLGPFLTEVDWTAPTPVGGHYQLTNHDVQRAGEKTAAAVTINLTSFPPSPTLVLSYADLLEIDRQIDDGNLATGNFRTGFNGWPIFWVRPKS